MRNEADDRQSDPRTALLTTIEAAARRWYPWGVPRGLFEKAMAEALSEQASFEHPPVSAEVAERAPSSEEVTHPEVRAQFIVPAPLNEEEESLLFRAVTQGLHWQWDDVMVVIRDELWRTKTGVPIVSCGVSEALASLGGSPDDARVRDALFEWDGRTLIDTVSLSDALTSREVKRTLWSHLQVLLAVVSEGSAASASVRPNNQEER